MAEKRDTEPDYDSDTEGLWRYTFNVQGLRLGTKIDYPKARAKSLAKHQRVTRNPQHILNDEGIGSYLHLAPWIHESLNPIFSNNLTDSQNQTRKDSGKSGVSIAHAHPTQNSAKYLHQRASGGLRGPSQSAN
jgi:hypothetical protein